jgi:ligand-binding SRPBCC domain-containing protein
MARWFALESADAAYFGTAPHVFRYTKHYDAPPERVWESLESDASISAWGPAVKTVTWTSPRPFGVGTTREGRASSSPAMLALPCDTYADRLPN